MLNKLVSIIKEDTRDYGTRCTDAYNELIDKKLISIKPIAGTVNFYYDSNTFQFYSDYRPETIEKIISTLRKHADSVSYGEHNAILQLVTLRENLDPSNRATVYWNRSYHAGCNLSKLSYRKHGNEWISLKTYLEENGIDVDQLTGKEIEETPKRPKRENKTTSVAPDELKYLRFKAGQTVNKLAQQLGLTLKETVIILGKYDVKAAKKTGTISTNLVISIDSTSKINIVGKGAYVPGKYVGYSLSGCIKDICDGRVQEKDVDKIVTPITIDKWHKTVKLYKEGYWIGYETKAERVFWSLQASGKIENLTQIGRHRLRTGSGRWTNVEDSKDMIKKLNDPICTRENDTIAIPYDQELLPRQK